jgi:FkbM family methyltransferase
MAVKKLLLNLLGEKKYLNLLARAFQPLYRTGLLGKDYQDIYFLKKIIRPGDYCIDIGAHLGYYTIELSRLAGDKGKVAAVEPMTPFHSTLQRLLKRKSADNVILHKVALGGSTDYVEMGIPQIGADRRFAFARIKENNAHLDFVQTERIKNESGDDLFLRLPRVDYIKCDVEGFEYEVFSSMPRTLETHRPMLLCELFDRGLLIRLSQLLKPLDYRPYILDNGRLKPLDVQGEGQIPSMNYYFLPPKYDERFRTFVES